MQVEEPKVSIVMNCFNGAKYLREAIESVLAQTYKNWELVFWDNQSTDESARIFREYDDARFKYYGAPEHTLLYEARALALQKVNGEYIAFLDVDDWWDVDKLALQIPLFENTEVGLVYGNYWLKNERKNSALAIANKNTLPEGWVLGDMLRDYVVGILTMVVRRSAIEKLDKVFDARYQIIGDFDLAIRLAARCKFACIQKPIAFYRWHGENASIVDAPRGVTEMQHWVENMSANAVISSNPNFVCVQNALIYSKVVSAVAQGQRRDAWRLFADYPWGWKKSRLLVVLLMPYALVRKLRA
jgi:glycosyltransferase involved in cell wall biosynthesis